MVSMNRHFELLFFRNDGGYYLPHYNDVSFLIHCSQAENKLYQFEKSEYEVNLFQKIFMLKQLLSSIKTTNRMLNITASVYANENGLDIAYF
jgi:branched-chain amino acid aminotransferase